MGSTRLRWFDAVIALAIVAGAIWLLASTADMGFTRDESFYFKYAQVYQDWFTRVAHPPKDAESPLGRADVVKTWSENFEHPPLLKVLFGWSWRVFADKRRPITGLAPDPDTTEAVRARVTHLTPSEGFAVGDMLQVLGPLPVDGDRSDAARTLGQAEVLERKGAQAVVRIDGISLRSIQEACREPVSLANADGVKVPQWISGCQAASSRPLQVLNESSAMRAPSWLMTGLLLALLYLFGAELFGRWAGLFAAAAFLLVPRHFFHAHLCTFDVGVCTMIVGTVYGFWKSMHSRVWAVLTGVIWGLALLTKLNAFFVPIPLIIAWLLPSAIRNAHKLFQRQWYRQLRKSLQVTLPDLPLAFLWMPPIGLVMLFSLWPRMWYDPAAAFYDYVNFHLSHVHYLQLYFGTILSAPPFPMSYPWVMTAVTVPAVLLLVFGIGCATMFWWERDRTSLFVRCLIGANLLFPIALISMPNTPIFGGVKHWLPTMAFFALIAGYGFDWMRRKLATRLHGAPTRTLATIALAASLLAPGAVASLAYADVGTSYYNELIGGVRGGADRGMHRQFWGYAGRFGLEYVNANAPRNARVAFHNTTWDAVTWYKRDGLLRSDIRWRRDPPEDCRHGAALYLFHHQESFAQDQIGSWRAMRTYRPVRVVATDGVPVLSVYRCNRRRGPIKARAPGRTHRDRGPEKPPSRRTPPR